MIGVEEHIERLSKRLEEVEMVIKWMPELTKQIERLEVKPLSRCASLWEVMKPL